MSKPIDFGNSLNEGQEEGKELTLLTSLRSLMEKLCYSSEQAMDLLSVPAGERAKLQVQL